jgi:fumarate hydratase, class II
MSATLGTFLKELEPSLTVIMFETLDDCARESSEGWNNVGTGHAANCELNYTPQREDGRVDISKALEANTEFDLSRQLWSFLVKKGAIPDPRAFINPCPHMSFVWGAANVAFLRQRFREMSAHHCYYGMEYSEDQTPLGSHAPVHPNDHVNMAQSSNDSFPSAMYIAAAVNAKQHLMPAVFALRDAIAAKSEAWNDIVKIGRTHMQDATPLTLGQEWSGYAGMLSDDLDRTEAALQGVYRLALGGTAVGTGINSAPGFAEAAAAEIAKLTGLPFITAPNKFTVQGSHDALVQLSGTLRTLAVSLYKIANDIRPMSCGPRAGFAELEIPENEPGSSIMPGKVNPTQCEALTMIAAQVMANDVAVGFGGAGGYLEMNVYKPLMIFNITHSITILTGGCVNFRKFLIEGTKPNLKKINEYVERSLMLVTALSPVIGPDKASKIAHYAMDNDLTLKAAALKLGFVTDVEFDRVVDPKKMVKPYVATDASAISAACA